MRKADQNQCQLVQWSELQSLTDSDQLWSGPTTNLKRSTQVNLFKYLHMVGYRESVGISSNMVW